MKMDTTPTGVPNDRPQPYPSLTSIKEAHTALLRDYKEGGEAGLLDSIEEFVTRGSAAGVFLDSYDERLTGQSLLDYWVTVLYRARRTPPDATLAEFDDSLSPVLDDALCPYRGLTAFQERDKDIFFGRQRLVETLVEKARVQKFLFVVGASGSGKSSLVLAGLIPVLKNGVIEGSKDWQYLPRVVPGHNPLRNLARALAGHYEQPAAWADQLADSLLSDANALQKAVSGLNPSPAVLVVDQFEEAYTLCTSDEAREAFINNLIAFAHAPGKNNRVILTIRTDYETYLAQTPALFDLFAEGQLRITPLTAAELRTAIEEPARRVGLRFEDGIVDALVKDILGEPAGLPLLQFTLLRLWKMREGGRSRITWKVYKALEGPRSALALTADEVYSQFSPQNKFAAKKILLRLARPSGNMEVTSNRVRRADLYFVAKDRINEVLGKLSEAGLIFITKGDVEDNDQVEVAHEALVRNWPLLTDWLEKERGAMRQRLRLTAAAEQWNEKKRDEGGLIGGELLKDALAYDDLNELEKEFVQASKNAAERAERERKEAEEREQGLVQESLIAYRQKAAEEAKNVRRLRVFVPVLAVLTLFALATATFAFVSERRARVSEVEARMSKDEAEQSRLRVLEESEKAKGLLIKEREARDEAQKAKDEAEQSRLRVLDESEKVKRLLIKEREARDAAQKAKTEAEEAKLEAISKAKLADEKSRELETALARVAEANNEIKRLSLIDQTRAQLADTHRQAYQLIDRNPQKAVSLLDTLWQSYSSNPKDFDPDGKKAVSVLSGQAKALHILSERVKRRSEDDEAKEYERRSKEKYEMALERLGAEIERAETTTGPDTGAVIDALEERAQVYEFHDYMPSANSAALADYLRAFDIQEKALRNTVEARQPVSDDALITLDQLSESIARLYRRLGSRRDELETFYMRLVEVKKQVPGTLLEYELYKVHNDLARSYLETDQLDKAEQHYRAALGVVEKVFGDDSPSSYLLLSLKNLAGILERQGDLKKSAEAAALYERALKVMERGGRMLNPVEEASVRMSLARLYFRLKKDEEAEINALKAKEVYESSASDYRPELVASLRLLGGIQNRLGKYDLAESVYQKLVSLYPAEAEKPDRNRLSAMTSLAQVYYKRKKLKEAVEVFLLAAEAYQKSGSSYDIYNRQSVLLDLSDVYREQKQFSKAESVANEALQLTIKNPTIAGEARARAKLASIHQDAGRYAEAEEQYKKAIERSAVLSLYYVDLKTEILEHYAELLDKLNRLAEAKALRAQAESLKPKGEDGGKP